MKSILNRNTNERLTILYISAFIRRPQKFETISHLFWSYVLSKSRCVFKASRRSFPILCPSHNVLTLHSNIYLRSFWSPSNWRLQSYFRLCMHHHEYRDTSNLKEVRHMWIWGVTQQLLYSKSHDFQAVFALKVLVSYISVLHNFGFGKVSPAKQL